MSFKWSNTKTLFCHLRKNKIIAIKKGKNTKMESTRENLQRKLQLLEQGIQETIETRFEVEIVIVVVEATSTTL